MKFTFAPNSRPLDGFTIRRAIHRGGFGEVYEAMTDGGREVALKLLQNNTEVELRGVRQCLNLSHPNIVTLFDVRRDEDGDHWIVMEYVAAPTLATVLAASPSGLPATEAARWVRGIADGVAFLHSRGLVHRDLKPANVFGGPGETIQVGDVGLSKFIAPSKRSAQTQSVGTVYYMAPEVAQGKYGPEVDQYSLAILAFELLTGRVPFDGESTGEILMKHLSDRPDLSAVDAATAAVIRRGLAKSPSDRFGSIAAFADAFETSLGLANTSAATPRPTDEAASEAASVETPRRETVSEPDPQRHEPSPVADSDDWWANLSPSRQGLIIFASLMTLGVVLASRTAGPLLPLLAILGGPALALSWHAEFDWLAGFARPLSNPIAGRRVAIGMGTILLLMLFGGRGRMGGELLILLSIAGVGLGVVWLVLAGVRLVWAFIREDVIGPSPLDMPPPTSSTEPTPKAASVQASVPPPRRPGSEPPPRIIDRLSLRKTLGAASLVPLLVGGTVGMLAVFQSHSITPDIFIGQTDRTLLAGSVLFGGSAIVGVWVMLLCRHLRVTGISRMIAAGCGGGLVGLLYTVAEMYLSATGDLSGTGSQVAFFGLLMGIRNPTWMVHPLRPGRFRIGAVALSIIVAMLAAAFTGKSVEYAMLWAAVVTSAAQIVAPYVDESRRLAARSSRPPRRHQQSPLTEVSI